MPQEYQPAPEVAEVARQLIDQHHSHLGPVRVEYVFISEAPKHGGKIVWGRARKISGLNAWLLQEEKEVVEPQEFFCIEILKSVWLQLDEKARKALVDHELTHCDVDEKGKLRLRPHDLEEFNIIVRRYGLWRDDVVLFFEAGAESRQANLGFESVEAGHPEGAKFADRVMDVVVNKINSGALGSDVKAKRDRATAP